MKSAPVLVLIVMSLAMFFFPILPHAAAYTPITLTAQTSCEGSGGAATCITSSIAVTAGELVVVGIGADGGTSCAVSTTIVFVGIPSFTLVGKACGTGGALINGTALMYSALAPTSTTGTATVTLVGAGATPSLTVGIEVLSPGSFVLASNATIKKQAFFSAYSKPTDYYELPNMTVTTGEVGILSGYINAQFESTAMNFTTTGSTAQYVGYLTVPGTFTPFFRWSGNVGAAMVAAVFGSAPTPPANTYQIVACTYFQLQCWTWPLLFTGMIVTPFMLVGTAARASPRGLAVLFMTTGMFALFTLVDTSTIDFVIPLLALVGVILFLLRSRPT